MKKILKPLGIVYSIIRPAFLSLQCFLSDDDDDYILCTSRTWAEQTKTGPADFVGTIIIRDKTYNLNPRLTRQTKEIDEAYYVYDLSHLILFSVVVSFVTLRGN